MAEAPITTSTPPSREMRARVADPFRWLRSEVDRIFEDFDPPRRLFAWGPQEYPPLGLTEDNDRYTVSVDVAGYDRDQIDISTESGSLVLRGKRAAHSERTDGGFLINERRQGEFERRVSLPRRIDPAGIRATLDKGLLRVELPKAPDPEARHIEIQSTR